MQGYHSAYPVLACLYCRTEFLQTSEANNTNTICKKCDEYLKRFGKPIACDVCNNLSAFIGIKCQKCTNLEIKFGPSKKCVPSIGDNSNHDKLECRGAFILVKCTYCRSEFQQTSRGNTSTICKKCEHNVKSYGKPTACEYCNIIAAFIGNKCQRCANSEIKYGPPVNCEQCKQKCAFDRHDDDKKVDGKLLCWLCTLSFKRALAKTKQTDADRRAHMKMSQLHKNKHKEPKMRSHNKRPNRPDVTKMAPPDDNGPANKMSRNNAAPGMIRAEMDPNSSDHVVAMTQLKEKIASLQKQVMQKDAELLNKEKLITTLKANHFTNEKEMLNKMKGLEKEYDAKFNYMNNRINSLLKEVATLSKGSKKGGRVAVAVATENSNNSSGTDSPSLQ